MKRTAIAISVILAAVWSCAWAFAADNAAITDSIGKVVLERASVEDIPKLVELLENRDYQVQKQSQEALVTFGGDATPALIKALEKGKPSVWVIGTLGYIKDERAIAPLSRLINSPDPEVGGAARGALQAIGGPAVAMLAGLLDKDGYRDAAAETLKSIGPDGDAIGKVRPLLASENWATRAAAVGVLGAWKDKGSLDQITGLLSDSQTGVREKAVVAYRLMAAGGYDIDLLLRLADDQDSFVQREAMAMMANSPSPRVVEPMLRIMESSDDPKVVAAAMSAAGHTKDPRLIDPLIKYLGDEDDLIVGQAVYFLGYQKAGRSAKDILALFSNGHQVKDPMIIQNACQALIDFGKPLDADDLHLFLPYLDSRWDYDTKYGVLDLVERYGEKGDGVTVKSLEGFETSEKDQVLRLRARTILGGLR